MARFLSSALSALSMDVAGPTGGRPLAEIQAHVARMQEAETELPGLAEGEIRQNIRTLTRYRQHRGIWAGAEPKGALVWQRSCCSNEAGTRRPVARRQVRSTRRESSA